MKKQAGTPRRGSPASTTSAASRKRSPKHRSISVDPFLEQHASLRVQRAIGPDGPATVLVNAAESPLAWLARRKGRDGQPMIAAHQLLAGERLRVDFTRAQLTPRVTANWSASIAQGRRTDSGNVHFSDAVLAAKQQVNQALAAVGPEFSGLLLDVCCFLKGLDTVETERRWPARAAKLVLQLGLDRLARHYGYKETAHGRARQKVRAWSAENAEPAAEGT